MLKESNTSNYEITPLTIAILPQQDDHGNTGSLILEENAEFSVNQSPSEVIEFACNFFGSSLKGRQDGTRVISGLTHKAPVSIDPSSGMYFLPTYSPVNPKCSWIAHTHINKVNGAPYHCTEVLFSNGKKIILDVSFGSMMNQVQRTAQFRYVLDNRIKNLKGSGSEWESNTFP